MSIFNLEGRVAIVTGASRGIGRAIAGGLAAQSCRVVVSSRDPDRCAAAAQEINETFPDAALAVPANIGFKEDLRRLVAMTRERIGPIDILVCNAATNPYFGPIGGISDEQFQKILSNNILSNHWLVQMVLPDMKAKGEGSIILISSTGGFIGSRMIGPYNISKAAGLHLVRNLASELGPFNIRVNGIAPGLVRTEFSRALWSDAESAARIIDRTALGRLADPEEMAAAAVFLAGTGSSYMTGQTLVLDGGLLIGAYD